jgi:hypothetical protein
MSGKLEAIKPQRKIELFSGTYFGACTLGGVIGGSRPRLHHNERHTEAKQLAVQHIPWSHPSIS